MFKSLKVTVLLFLLLTIALTAQAENTTSAKVSESKTAQDSPIKEKASTDPLVVAEAPQQQQQQQQQQTQQQDTITTDIWQRIRVGLALPKSDNPLIQAHENWYSARSDYLAQTLERSRPYLFHIVEEVEKREMPLEIALLPIIESSFNPQAVSPAKAAGIWQFIPSTGKIYGLDQNHWYDGRRDIVAATRAALDHLDYLHNLFGDWELALAAYNCGEGCVSRAIAKNRAAGLSTDFSALSLPTETRHYVPKLQAVRNIINDPERFDLSLAFLANEPYFMQVKLPHPMEAKSAARLAEMDMDEFLTLNPAFRRKVIYTDTPSQLLLPVGQVKRFRSNLESGDINVFRLKKYLAQKGESVRQIADKFDISLQWLKEHNPLDIGRKGTLKTSTALIVPVIKQAQSTPLTASTQQIEKAAISKSATAAKHSARVTKLAKKNRSFHRTHTVRKGDTLYDLAKRYQVTVADIRELNGHQKVLRPGEKLTIPEAS